MTSISYPKYILILITATTVHQSIGLLTVAHVKPRWIQTCRDLAVIRTDVIPTGVLALCWRVPTLSHFVHICCRQLHRHAVEDLAQSSHSCAHVGEAYACLMYTYVCMHACMCLRHGRVVEWSVVMTSIFRVQFQVTRLVRLKLGNSEFQSRCSQNMF